MAVKIHANVPSGDAATIVYLRPIKWSEAAAKMLPKNAPHGGIEPRFNKKMYFYKAVNKFSLKYMVKFSF